MAAAIATLTSKGQITLPKKVRNGLNIKTGDKIVFAETDEGWKIKVLSGDPREIMKYLGRGLEDSGLSIEGLHAEFEADDGSR